MGCYLVRRKPNKDTIQKSIPSISKNADLKIETSTDSDFDRLFSLQDSISEIEYRLDDLREREFYDRLHALQDDIVEIERGLNSIGEHEAVVKGTSADKSKISTVKHTEEKTAEELTPSKTILLDDGLAVEKTVAIQEPGKKDASDPEVERSVVVSIETAKKRPKKRLVMVGATASLLAFVFAATVVDFNDTFAWLVGNFKASNVLNTPAVEISIDESNGGILYNGWTSQPVDWGEDIPKYTKFTNESGVYVLLRVSYSQDWVNDSSGSDVYLSNYYRVGENFVSLAVPNWTAEGFENTDIWFDDGNGWYYYRRALAPGESTQDIVDSVSFINMIPTEYSLAEYTLSFKAEVCQYSLNTENENQWASWESFGMTFTESSGTLTWSTDAP